MRLIGFNDLCLFMLQNNMIVTNPDEKKSVNSVSGWWYRSFQLEGFDRLGDLKTRFGIEQLHYDAMKKFYDQWKSIYDLKQLKAAAIKQASEAGAENVTENVSIAETVDKPPVDKKQKAAESDPDPDGVLKKGEKKLKTKVVDTEESGGMSEDEDQRQSRRHRKRKHHHDRRRNHHKKSSKSKQRSQRDTNESEDSSKSEDSVVRKRKRNERSPSDENSDEPGEKKGPKKSHVVTAVSDEPTDCGSDKDDGKKITEELGSADETFVDGSDETR